MAFEFGIDPETLNGQNKTGRARALVQHFGRRGLLDTLLAQLVEERPHVDWHSALLDTGELAA